MKKYFSVFATAFAIIGSVIGAGFITGREILTFFNKNNIVWTTVVLTVVFTFAFFVLLSSKQLPNVKFISVFEPIILIGNLIIVSGMISAVDEIVFNVFSIPKTIPIISIITLIISLLIVKKGTGGLKIANAVLTPIMIIFLVVSVWNINGENYNLNQGISVFSVITYVGINTFMSAPFFIDLGKNLNKKQAFFSSIISSVIICFIIFLMLSRLNASGEIICSSAVPLLTLFAPNKTLFVALSIIMYFGILTTLLSSHYPLFQFCETFKKHNLANVIVLVVAFIISRFGFYNIINYLYPVLGALGAVYLVLVLIFSKNDKENANN